MLGDSDDIEKKKYNGTYKLYDMYFKYNLTIEYDTNNMAEYMQISNGFDEDNCYDVLLYGKNIFKTESNLLIDFIENKYDKYDRHDSEIKTSYIFKKIGISLWKEISYDVISKEDWFQNLNDEQKKYEERCKYFETIAVFRKGYYDL